MPVTKESAVEKRLKPRVLIVDDEPAVIEVVRDILGRDCRLMCASNIRQAESIIEKEGVDLLLTDVCLPDGDGMNLIPRLRERHPSAAAVVITGKPSVNGTISALRAGVVDFLPKPFNAENLQERVRVALRRQAGTARRDQRLTRLKSAVRKLNVTRHTISKKVDLLCNDLVAAYGDLSRQMDGVRMQESFRKLLSQANDLEQLLCHTMDWILRHAGYCNVAIWLSADQGDYELGAYMKYSIPGEPALTNAMRHGLLRVIEREGNVHLQGEELREKLTPAELKSLGGQEIMGVNCTYLGEALSALVMFRDEKSPFTEDDDAMLKNISPIFAVALANMVRRSQEEPDEENDGSVLEDEGGERDSDPREQDNRERDNHKRDGGDPKNRKADSDWWKRGEPPPF